ncbi:MAG: hypothetical protein ACTHMJ_05010 [Thermomicrobiales bacterium]
MLRGAVGKELEGGLELPDVLVVVVALVGIVLRPLVLGRTALAGEEPNLQLADALLPAVAVVLLVVGGLLLDGAIGRNLDVRIPGVVVVGDLDPFLMADLVAVAELALVDVLAGIVDVAAIVAGRLNQRVAAMSVVVRQRRQCARGGEDGGGGRQDSNSTH